jgi:hypothetical protein
MISGMETFDSGLIFRGRFKWEINKNFIKQVKCIQKAEFKTIHHDQYDVFLNMQFSKYIFWDADPDELDTNKHSRYIIDRVVSYGTWKDWKKLLKLYGDEKIKDTVISLRNLDPKTLSFLSLYFDVPQKAFRCYTFKQSNPIHFQY